MKKNKILIFVLLATIIMISISIVSAVNTTRLHNKNQDEKTHSRLNSPLFKYRTRQSTQDNMQPFKQKIYNVLTKFFQNRLFIISPILNHFLKYDEKQNDPLWSSPHGTFCPTMGCVTSCDKC